MKLRSPLLLLGCLLVVFNTNHAQDTGRNVQVIQTAQAGQYLQGILFTFV